MSSGIERYQITIPKAKSREYDGGVLVGGACARECHKPIHPILKIASSFRSYNLFMSLKQRMT